jgi:hypothetical protein
MGEDPCGPATHNEMDNGLSRKKRAGLWCDRHSRQRWTYSSRIAMSNSRASLPQPGWLDTPDNDSGFITHDIHRDGL